MGHAHRNAADSIDQQSTEEVLANFRALPFAAAISDSDEEVEKTCDTDVVIEDPATHILHAPAPTKGDGCLCVCVCVCVFMCVCVCVCVFVCVVLKM